MTTWSRTGFKRLAEQLLVLVGAIDFGRVEEGDADVDGAVQRRDRVLLRLAAIGEAHAHAAKADGKHAEFSSELARVHDDLLSSMAAT